MNRTTILTCTAALSCSVVFGQIRAQPRVEVQPDVRQPTERAEPASEGALARAANGQLAKATDLIGTQVASRDGQSFGTIKDLVVNTGTNQVQYVLLEGQASAEQGYLVLPWAITEYTPVTATSKRPMIHVQLDRTRLRSAPYVSVNEYRTFHDHAWVPKVNTFYREDMRRFRGARDRDGIRDREGIRDRDDARDGIEDRRDRNEDAREERRDRAEDARDRAEDAAERANDTRERVRDRLEDAREDAADRLEDARDDIDD